MDKDYGHKPALLAECMEALDIRPGGTYLDGTLGRAGHALELLRRLVRFGPSNRLYFLLSYAANIFLALLLRRAVEWLRKAWLNVRKQRAA